MAISGEPLFGLSVLGYSRNLAMQHGGHEGGPVPSVALRPNSKETKIQQF